MEDFKKIETDYYIGYLVISQVWNREKQYFENYHYVLFNNEQDAQKCLNILDEYKNNFKLFLRNKIIKDLFIYDGNIIHTISGIKINYNDYVNTKTIIHKIEDTYESDSWGYMDSYIKVFKYKPRRPRSCLGILLYFCTCYCLFTDDVFGKVI